MNFETLVPNSAKSNKMKVETNLHIYLNDQHIDEKVINIPNYTKERGVEYSWIENFEIEVQLGDNGVKICANSAGLSSLANLLLGLAQESVPNGYHLHLDEYNSLEEGSLELLIQKIEDNVSNTDIPEQKD